MRGYVFKEKNATLKKIEKAMTKRPLGITLIVFLAFAIFAVVFYVLIYIVTIPFLMWCGLTETASYIIVLILLVLGLGAKIFKDSYRDLV